MMKLYTYLLDQVESTVYSLESKHFPQNITMPLFLVHFLFGEQRFGKTQHTYY